MIEDILAYTSGTRLSDSFSALLEADLDDDAQLFFLRMAGDIGDLPGGAPALRRLLGALTGDPAAGGTWRELYRELARLVAINPTEALRFPRAFLAENADLAESPVSRGLELVVCRHGLGA